MGRGGGWKGGERGRLFRWVRERDNRGVVMKVVQGSVG